MESAHSCWSPIPPQPNSLQFSPTPVGVPPNQILPNSPQFSPTPVGVTLPTSAGMREKFECQSSVVGGVPLYKSHLPTHNYT